MARPDRRIVLDISYINYTPTTPATSLRDYNLTLLRQLLARFV
ncbi:hypothetical protein [Spongiactinospora sp. TRM90649]|nr:hypothetical protein [Spongiactinospora sp. TRM90649]MDF5755573.1 hypothetical protein [Spongiactinospora sp. TRM90649]